MANDTVELAKQVLSEHPQWIPTRLPKAKKSRKGNEIVDLQSMKDTPKDLFNKNMELVKQYNNFPTRLGNLPNDEAAEHHINHMVDNLLALHDQVPEGIRKRSKLWYDGARKITDRWSDQYGVPDHSVAGVLAALSPQMDWFKNVSLGNRVLEIMKHHHDTPMGDDMLNRFTQMMTDKKGKETAMAKYKPLIDSMMGKSLSDIDGEGLPDKERLMKKAMWLRLHDETYGDRSHHIISPEGDLMEKVRKKDGSVAGTGWGSLKEIGKAVGAYEAAGKPENISELMGMKHKVRNFYNNILVPNSKRGDITADTHAVAAALYKPLSGNSLEVAHNLGTNPPKGFKAASDSAISGVSGTYPLVAEAYRRAAEKRGLLPREMQSITWEAVRSLFPDTLKRNAKTVKAINDVWDNHRKGLIDQAKARSLINDIALGPKGQIPPPDWHGRTAIGRSSQFDEALQNPSNAGQLRGAGTYGPFRPGVDEGGRDGSASSPPTEALARGGMPYSNHPAARIPGIHIVGHLPIFHGKP